MSQDAFQVPLLLLRPALRVLAPQPTGLLQVLARHRILPRLLAAHFIHCRRYLAESVVFVRYDRRVTKVLHVLNALHPSAITQHQNLLKHPLRNHIWRPVYRTSYPSQTSRNPSEEVTSGEGSVHVTTKAR